MFSYFNAYNFSLKSPVIHDFADEDLQKTHDELRNNLHGMLLRLAKSVPSALRKALQSFLSMHRPSKPNFFDLMGLVVAEALNVDHCQLSQEREHIRNGRKHMPIYTACNYIIHLAANRS